MRPMCVSDSCYLRKNESKYLKILTNCIKLESRRTVLRSALLVQDTSKARGGIPGDPGDGRMVCSLGRVPRVQTGAQKCAS